jgi:hypothetical protein
MSSASSESFHQEVLPVKYEPTLSSGELPTELEELQAVRKDVVDLKNELKSAELDAAE